MLKSLFSGVSGLQSHQVAMDIESNNIANVNTVGYKYSRANFSDLLAQTRAIATAPQGALGGKNPVQVGLGSTVSSATRIFSQGSVQNSDKNTDVAIQGDGFFIISPDGGNTYKYTRAGDFKFDAGGNFVDNNGFIAQGWLRDKTTGKVDSTAPIANINIPPGLTTPAQPTQEVVLKANLNSGSIVKSFSPAYAVDKNGKVEADAAGNSTQVSGNTGVMFNETGEAFSLQKGQGVWISFKNTTTTASDQVSSSDDLNLTFKKDDGTDYDTITASSTGDQDKNGKKYVAAINAKTSITGISATYDSDTNKISLENANDNKARGHNITIKEDDAGSGLKQSDSSTTAHKYEYDPSVTDTTSNTTKKFNTMASLREAMQKHARDVNNDGTEDDVDTEVVVNDQGKILVTNPDNGGSDDYDLNLHITSIVGTVGENTRFSKNMEALNSVLAKGSSGKAFSQGFEAATHSSSIDIFDSLGSKHTLRMEFRKTKLDRATGSEWAMTITVPKPAEINTDTSYPANEKRGSIRFNNDGSLATYNPPNVSFSGNNGSSPDQQVSLFFGTANKFDGMTSFDNLSSTSGISQDGYTGGDLVGIRIDQSGTLVGSFSNGHSFGLAQIGMAKFTNNEGLSTEGGNVYTQTANSGDPIIGTAATAGRGFIQSSALEASNVDLSRALTQLIIIQRGFQANGKTITTSDQLLQTLIGLKQ
ncbi:Flagellar hook protein FlgE [hydrothermal vent metagenome]|uniref:Flagellar hook protein FlgE n=1 Tax=hydrothermal vent metagenome TaxID=652676 RepID=A0A1W1CRU0_9ZZZZ